VSVARLSLLLVFVWGAACSGTASEQAARSTPAAAAERGRMLFRNKGCVTCHANTRVEGESGLLAIGPDLSTYSNAPDFLRAWLADPKALRPDTPMPDFDLTAAEIEDLIAFLNEPR